MDLTSLFVSMELVLCTVVAWTFFRFLFRCLRRRSLRMGCEGSSTLVEDVSSTFVVEVSSTLVVEPSYGCDEGRDEGKSGKGVEWEGQGEFGKVSDVWLGS